MQIASVCFEPVFTRVSASKQLKNNMSSFLLLFLLWNTFAVSFMHLYEFPFHLQVEMSPGGTTGTVIGDEGTTLLRTSSGLTVKRMSGGSPGRSGNLLSTVTQVADNSQMQEMSLPTRKLFTEDGQEISGIVPETEMVTIQGKSFFHIVCALLFCKLVFIVLKFLYFY